MKKIMFNDFFGLTKAVLDGRKTMTRRIAYDFRKHASNKVGKCVLLSNNNLTYKDGEVQVLDELSSPQYQVGEIVAIAQAYRDIWQHIGYMTEIEAKQCAGYSNKMFVRADLMPRQIRFTDIRVERLQDISDEDCIKEGIYMDEDPMNPQAFIYTFPNAPQWYFTPREAFADLIDKVSGKGTWESNPFTFAYSFELVK